MRRCILMAITLTLLPCGVVSHLDAQVPDAARPMPFLLAGDEARDIFNLGVRLYNDHKYAGAESRFREVMRRFPDNAIADRSAYYLIRTLVRRRQPDRALEEITLFESRFPGSNWLTDVREERIRLTNEIPRTLAFQVPPSPPAPPAPRTQVEGSRRVFRQLAGELDQQRLALEAGMRAAEQALRSWSAQLSGSGAVDPEISLQQEIMGAVMRSDPDRAMEIAAERLAQDPSDPVVLSNFHTIARSDSPRAIEMLRNIAKNSSSSRARKEAIFWISRWDGDENRIIDVLLDVLPTIRDDDTAGSLAFSLSRVGSPRAVEVLVTLATEAGRSEDLRKNAVFWISRTGDGDPVGALGRIYRGASDNVEVRKQVTFALSKVDDDAAAANLLGEIARLDPSTDVRKQAVFWLGRMDTPDALRILEDLLRNP